VENTVENVAALMSCGEMKLFCCDFRKAKARHGNFFAALAVATRRGWRNPASVEAKVPLVALFW
jgi:hypothetical protein